MAIHHYPHHIGDYSKHTKSLTLMEHGAYRLLLDFYYTNEGPLPNDRQMMFRACSAHTPAERRAVDKMLSKFFSPRDGVWHHPRADEEIKIIKNRSELARSKANKRHAVACAGADAGAVLANSHKPIAIKLASNEDDICREEILPSAWHDAAEQRGIPDEQIYKSWRKFKDRTSHPYRLQNWLGWVARERINGHA